MLALKSGELAADAIHGALEKGDTSKAALGAWAPMFNQGIDRMRRLVCEYYDGFNFGTFIRHHPELRGAITDLLIGDLFTEAADRVWGPMDALAGRRQAGHRAVARRAGRAGRAGQGQRDDQARRRALGRLLARSWHTRSSSAAGSSSTRRMPPASSTSARSSATWRRPSTRCGARTASRSSRRRRRTAGRASPRRSTTSGRCASRTSSRCTSASIRSRPAACATPAASSAAARWSRTAA